MRIHIVRKSKIMGFVDPSPVIGNNSLQTKNSFIFGNYGIYLDEKRTADHAIF